MDRENKSVRTVEGGSSAQCRLSGGRYSQWGKGIGQRREGGRHDEVQGCKGAGDSHTDTPRRLVNRGPIVPEEANLTSVSEVMSFPAKQQHFLSPSFTLCAPVCFFHPPPHSSTFCLLYNFSLLLQSCSNCIAGRKVLNEMKYEHAPFYKPAF